MKKVFYLLLAIASLSLLSCSSNREPKSITPTSTEFISGELAKYIEVVDEPCKLTYTEKDGAISSQFIRLQVKLKLVKEGIQDVDPRDIGFTRLLAVANVKLVDKDGVEVQDLDVSSDELLKLKKLLTKNIGDTETIVFEGQYYNPDDAPKWFDEAAQFTPYLTADIECEDETDNYSQRSSVNTNSTANIASDFSSLASVLLQESDLTNLTKAELRILRNAIYARHGYIFKSPELTDFFSKFSWYNPTTSQVSQSSLNSIENDNIKLIQKFEANAPEGSIAEAFSQGIALASSAFEEEINTAANEIVQNINQAANDMQRAMEEEASKFGDAFGFNNSVEVSEDEDWDKILDEYDELYKSFLKLYKKKVNGDSSTDLEIEVLQLVNKMTPLSAKLVEGSNKKYLSKSQEERHSKMEIKHLKELAELQELEKKLKK